MTRNNTFQALEILEAAYQQLSKINYDSSAFWAEGVEQAKLHIQYAIDEINDDIHASQSIIHPENQF